MPANTDNGASLDPDGYPCKLNPGLISHVSWHMGVNEPQMRKTQHYHAMFGVLGYRTPAQLFESGLLRETLVRIWKYAVSITYRSPEAYAAQNKNREAMEALKEEPQIGFSQSQKELIGESYYQQSLQAQAEARGLNSGAIIMQKEKRAYEALPPVWLNDDKMSAEEWSKRAVVRFNTSFRSCGNHVCQKRVCLKGKLGRKGLCRMMYFRYVERLGTKKRKKRSSEHEDEGVRRGTVSLDRKHIIDDSKGLR